MRKWNQQDGLANLSVDEAYSTWETWLLIDNQSASAHCLQLRITLAE